MNINIKSETVGYNNKILVSDSRFSLGRNDTVNALAPSHRTPIEHAPIPKASHFSAIKLAHEEERTA